MTNSVPLLYHPSQQPQQQKLPCVDSTVEADETVEAALDAIVQHFSDPVHKVASDYKADAEEQDVSPVLQYWIDRLSENSSKDGTATNTNTELIHKLLNGYTQHIRPKLFTSPTKGLSVSGVPILLQYEQLISRVLERNHTVRYSDSNDNQPVPLLLSSQKQKGKKQPKTETKLFGYLDAMASDLSLLTELCVIAKAEESERTQQELEEQEATTYFLIANVALPTMIRLVTHPMRLLGRSVTCTGTDEHGDRVAVRKCIVAMLAFKNPHLDPRDVVLYLETSLLVVQENPTFLYAPISNGSKITATDATTAYLNLGSHLKEGDFWDCLRLNGTSWEDPETEVASRAVESFWQILHTKLGDLGNNTTIKGASPNLIEEIARPQNDNLKQDAAHKDKRDDLSFQTVIRDCLRALSRGDDQVDLARAVRAHFFGRDVTPLPQDQQLIASQRQTTRLHLGRVVEHKQDDPIKAMTKPFLESPSRVHVAMHYILRLQKEDTTMQGSDLTCLLEEMFPIVYELLSADAAAHIAMGASALIHLLSLTTPDGDTTTSSFDFKKWAGTLLPVLDLACQVCRDGPPYALIARAQNQLCGMSQLESSMENKMVIAKHRRKTTRYFFSVLDKHSHKVSDPDGLLWALLVGGILPLLYQHATLPEAIGNVDAMEIGRLGLTSLLPILRYSAGWTSDSSEPNTTRKLLAPCVLALVYLLHAAYPTMPRHGGKIMSEILGLLSSLKRQKLSTTSDLALLKLVENAAFVALVVCGERANAVLETVVSGGKYEAEMIQLAHEVRHGADEWKQTQQNNTASSDIPSSNFLG